MSKTSDNIENALFSNKSYVIYDYSNIFQISEIYKFLKP